MAYRSTVSNRYATHSVLAECGEVGKDTCSCCGVYQLTNDLIRRAGFSNDKSKSMAMVETCRRRVLTADDITSF